MSSCLSNVRNDLLRLEDEVDDMITISLSHWHSKHTQRRRWWVHDIIFKMNERGTYTRLIKELDLDGERFHQYFRMSREQFGQVLHFVEPHLVKTSQFRETICPRQRLGICIRFLATGESYKSLSFSYRVGASTIAEIVPEVREVIWETISATHMPMPKSEADWKLIADNFNESWQFPHCCGAIDGKHIVVKAPPNSGSLYYNYKSTFSIVLLAVVDANYMFITIDVGSYGKNNDAGIFAHSKFGKKLQQHELNLPRNTVIFEAPDLGPLPYVFVGDEAFPLLTCLMRPFHGKNASEGERIFNYRLSRARRIVENAFGILACRWRICNTKIAVLP